VTIQMQEDSMSEKFLKLSEVLEQTGLARSTIYALMAAGKFPKQVKPTPHCSRWTASSVIEWQKAIMAKNISV